MVWLKEKYKLEIQLEPELANERIIHDLLDLQNTPSESIARLPVKSAFHDWKLKNISAQRWFVTSKKRWLTPGLGPSCLITSTWWTIAGMVDFGGIIGGVDSWTSSASSGLSDKRILLRRRTPVDALMWLWYETGLPTIWFQAPKESLSTSDPATIDHNRPPIQQSNKWQLYALSKLK